MTTKRVQEVEREVRDFEELRADIKQQIEDLEALREETIEKIKKNSEIEFKKILGLVKEIKKDFREYEEEVELKEQEVEALARYICDVLKESKKGLYIDFIYKKKFKGYDNEEKYEEKDVSISKRGFYTKDNWRDKRARIWNRTFESKSSCFESADFCNQILEKTPSKHKEEMKKVVNYMNLIAKRDARNTGRYHEDNINLTTEFILPKKILFKVKDIFENSIDFDDEPREIEIELDKIQCNGELIYLSPQSTYRRNQIGVYETVDNQKDFLAISYVKPELTKVLQEHSKKVNKLLKEIKKEKKNFSKTLEPYLLLGDDIL